MAVPLLADLGWQEIVLILLVVVLLFGAKKLPELARGSGRALRIFKAETKGLLDDDDDDDVATKAKTDEERQIEAQRRTEAAQRIDAPAQDPVQQPVQQPTERPVGERRPDAER